MAHYSLVISLGPVVYGFYRGHRLLPTASLLGMTASIAYLLDPQSTEKKALDIIVSKSVGIIYFVYGWNYINSPSARIYGYMNAMGIISAYQASYSYYPYRISFHMMFHYLAALGKIMVIYST